MNIELWTVEEYIEWNGIIRTDKEIIMDKMNIRNITAYKNVIGVGSEASKDVLDMYYGGFNE